MNGLVYTLAVELAIVTLFRLCYVISSVLL